MNRFPEIKWGYSLVLIFMAAALFLPIRGGLSAAVMNVGWVYFSDNMFLNHAAINPFWNLLDSLAKNEISNKQYRFFSEEKAQSIVDSLYFQPKAKEQAQVVSAKKPNLILVILESFSANVIGSLGGENDVTPNLNRLSEEGVLFTHFYSVSFRTDRGVSAVMSGYPSQPQSCIMKYPAKTGNLPHIGKTLKSAGYDLGFYYGGDENFTNMRSYLVNGGFSHIVSDKDFSRSDYASSWGAADGVVFNRLLADLDDRDDEKPFFNVLLTLSSHEPFTVPMPSRFTGETRDDLYRNSIYYTDSCIGDFIEKAKKQKWWQNTVVAFVSDHAFNYPEGIEMHVPERFHIIMLWLGGAIDRPMTVDKVGYQPDFINTILGQLHMDDTEFRFGKNLLDGNTPEFACYTYNHGIGFVEKEGSCSIDLNTNRVILRRGNAEGLEDKAKAFLQVTFEDFAKR